MMEECKEDDKFSCKFKDGSKFVMPHDSWQKAWNIKYPNISNEKVKQKFKQRVERYWREKKVPTKFLFDIEGKERENGAGFTYTPVHPFARENGSAVIKTRAELAEKVMYTLIRAPLLSIALKENSEEEKEKERPKVITLNGTVYDGEKKEKKSLNELLDKGKEEKGNKTEDGEKEEQ